MSIFETRVAILEQTTHGPILEIAFVGKHRNGVGHDMAAAVRKAVDANAPAAIVLNMLHFKYRFGNDIGGILQVFYDQAADPRRPGCILAQGATKRSLSGLLGPAKIEEAFGLKYFAELADALTFLRRELEGLTA